MAYRSDADGDGIPDTVENGSNADVDADGYADDLTDSDGDGMLDVFDSDPGDPNTDDSNIAPPGTDGDGLPDYLDLDSDGDGLTVQERRRSPRSVRIAALSSFGG